MKWELARVTQERDFLKRAAAGFKDERRYVLRQAYDQLLAAAADLRQRVRRMVRELAPRLAWKSRTEITWIYRAAVNALLDQADQYWRAKIALMPTVASRGLSLVDPSDGRSRAE